MKPQAVVLDMVRTMTGRPGNLPFAYKYQPCTETELMDKELKTVVKRFIGGFYREEEREKAQALMLVGPVGCGKTVAVRAIARSMKLILLEMSTKDVRHGQALQRVLGEASQTRKVESVSSSALLLLDDVDILFDSEKGFHKAAYDLILRSKCPVIMTAAHTPPEFRDKLKIDKFDMKCITETEAGLKLSLINKLEHLNLSDPSLSALYRYFHCSLCALFNSLQLRHLHLILGFLSPVTALDSSGTRVTAKIDGFNWISEGFDYKNWLNFVYLNTENSGNEEISQESAVLDLISVYDSCKMEENQIESQYNLRVYTKTVDNFMTKRMNFSKKLILIDQGTPLKSTEKPIKRALSRFFSPQNKQKSQQKLRFPVANDSFLD